MQTTDGSNENIPTSPGHQLSPILQIPKHEPLSPQNFTQGELSSQSPSSSSQLQNSIHRIPSSSLSQDSTNASHSAIPPAAATTITTIMSNSISSPPKNLICGPPLPAQLSSSSTRIPWPLMPPPHQPPPCHQSPMMPYYPPMGVPPPFPPHFPMPYPHDQFHSFHHPMLLGNNNNLSNGQIYSQPWSTGLFDCFSDIKNCFITCLCPCVTFGQVDEILSQGKMTWWEAALMFGLLETLCCQASLVFAWYHRVQFRKKYNLMGNLFSEFAITLFCMRLVLCQNYRQLNKLGFDVALGWKANKKKQRRIASQNAVQFVPPLANPGMFG
ncbi:cell number regulator 1-like [Solanum dulcamara]|uniref:cell number regulator 1-like n=1 Tax=Solanum dulcamara TaxID=45834 RepID=UPI0024864B05|nr:cell number regulator 1-like [Solanum dulcamara]